MFDQEKNKAPNTFTRPGLTVFSYGPDPLPRKVCYSDRAGLLACGSHDSPGLPTLDRQWHITGFHHHSQLRGSEGFTPSSLFFRQACQAGLERVSMPVPGVDFPEQLVACLRGEGMGAWPDDRAGSKDGIRQR